MALGKIQFTWKDPDFCDAAVRGITCDHEIDSFWKQLDEICVANGINIGEYLTIEVDLDTKTVKIL